MRVLLRYGIEFSNDLKSKVHKYTVSKRIELESPGCSGLEENLISYLQNQSNQNFVARFV